MESLHPFLHSLQTHADAQAATAKAEAIAAAAADASTKASAAKQEAQQTAAQDATTKTNAVASIAAATPSRIRAKRVPVPALAIGAAQAVAVAWDTPFPSTAYTVPTPGVEGPVLLGLPVVSNRTATGCTVTLKNTGVVALAAGAATLHVLAIHDPLPA